ncbi:glycosyltransferase family 2 protein [Rhizobium skierniewicense]|uniref:glycosyltransferase family 2 protein n=1 Tax=Rhizobium skierniewicense TaxID=984260 RepID=UPI001573A932|nr:glycosyltransferase family 2 protein [Rhizobium skierniewicense]NTF32484.1 glycosyltransferase [Rhizobium skierniewicense]
MNLHLQAHEARPCSPQDSQELAAFLKPNPTILACLTLYNEPAEALMQTLSGLIRNQLDLKRRRQSQTPSLVICMMLDGVRTLDPSTAAMLERLGFGSAQQWTLEGNEQPLLISAMSLSVNDLLVRLGQHAMPWNGTRIRLLLCKKPLNRGKLDSHAWFFRTIAPLADPDFIVQIDAGSIPDDPCMGALLEHMSRHPQCAAAATHILTPSKTDSSLLLNWQHNDFLWSKATDWPIGHALDYIEVVPGQCCMLRWSALRQSPGAAADPLDIYLGATEDDGLLRRNLYLAEDRVLGLAIVEATGAAIHYLPAAVVKTDPCTTLDELLRQRRRWINSTVAARLTAFSRLPDILSSPVFGWGRKFSIVLSILFGMYQTLLLLVLPGMSIFFFARGARNVAGPFAGNADIPALELAAGAAFFLCWAWMLASMRQGLAEGGMFGKWKGAWLYVLLAVSVFGNFVAVATAPIAVTLLGIVVLMVSAALIRLDRSIVSYWQRCMPFQLLLAPALSLYLTSYAFANISDVSWGTKGLSESRTHPGQHLRWRRVRDAILTIWAVASACLALFLGLQAAEIQSIILMLFLATFYLPAFVASALLLARPGSAFTTRPVDGMRNSPA